MGAPRTTQLIGGPFDGHTEAPLVIIKGDVVLMNKRWRYVGTGNITSDGHWEAVHDHMDPRLSQAVEAIAQTY